VVTENLIVSEVEEGFRVYSPNAPRRAYLVSRDPAAPTCTCPDFGHHAQDPEWRCKHILAVYDDLGASASGSEGRAECPPSVGGHGNGGDTSMLIKRSVSPDGRIDALSVEFSCPVDTRNGEVLVSRFLNGGGSSPQRVTEQSSRNEAIPCKIVKVPGGDRGEAGCGLEILARDQSKVTTC
jgi:hypothetical protein